MWACGHVGMWACVLGGGWLLIALLAKIEALTLPKACETNSHVGLGYIQNAKAMEATTQQFATVGVPHFLRASKLHRIKSYPAIIAKNLNSRTF